MANSSNIEWTDATWSVVTGCARVSPGCQNCYAERLTATRLAHQKKYAGLAVLSDSGEARWTREVRLHPDVLTDPLHWKKPKRVFVCSMSDLFQEGVPFEFIDKVFAVMALCPQHTFQVLTKRPERMAEYLTRERPINGETCATNGIIDDMVYRPDRYFGFEFGRVIGFKPRGFQWPLPNVWMGASVEDQKRADERIPHLLRCPAAVRFLSVEPLLGPVDLVNVEVPEKSDQLRRPWREPSCFNCLTTQYDDVHYHQPPAAIDWVIVGGESGPGARPMDIAWVRSIVAQCRAAGTSCFVKQLGSNPKMGLLHCAGGNPLFTIRDRKGGDPSEWPEDLRIRQFPDRQPVPA